MRRRAKKKARTRRAFEPSTGPSKSGSLVVDLGEVVLGGLRTVGNELTDIFSGRLGPRDEHFTARTGEVRLDLDSLVQRLGRSELVEAGEERFRVLIHRLLNVAADLGGFADGVGHSGLDRSGHLLGTGIDVGGALLGGLSLLLHELTGGFRNFHVLELGECLGDGREGLLDGVINVGGLGGHGGLSILRGLSYGLTPSGFGPGQSLYGTANGAI